MSTATASFAGSIVRNYQRYLVPLLFEDYARDLAARAAKAPGRDTLELACGTGALTTALSSALGADTPFIATDLQPDMIDAARARLNGGGERITFRPADGTDLPFADGSFDRIVCQFGVMFYGDRDRGYREAARVLRPGGTFAFNVWDSFATNPIPRLIHEAIAALLPEDPPAFLTVPWGYHDLSRIRAELEGAGFGRITMSVLPRTARARSVRDAVEGLLTGSPFAAELERRGVAAEAFEAAEHALRREFGDGELRAPMQAIAVEARR